MRLVGFARAALTRRFDAIVVSYGGAATTTLLRYLAPHLRVNHWNSQWDGIKHVDSPQHPRLRRLRVGRAVYVFDHPVRAVASLFRRGFARHMAPKLTSRHGGVWAYRRRYARHPLTLTLDEYARSREEVFGIERHLRSWTAASPASFPVLTVKYDALFESVDVLSAFLALSPSAAATFPPRQPRQTDLDTLDATTRGLLHEKLAGAVALYESLPDVGGDGPVV